MNKNVNVNSFKVGERVVVKKKNQQDRSGTIVQVVQAHTYPDPNFVPMFRKGRQLASRPFESYVVMLDTGTGKDKYLWPFNSQIERQTIAGTTTGPVVNITTNNQSGGVTAGVVNNHLMGHGTINTVFNADGSETTTIEQVEVLTDGTTVKTIKTTVKPAPKPVLTTDFIFAVDESGSMDWVASKVPIAVLSKIKAISEEATKTGLPQPNISILTFEEGKLKWRVKRVAANMVTNFEYRPGGSTPQFDAMGTCLEEAMTWADFKNPNHSFVFEIVTDGAENSSRRFCANQNSYGRRPSATLIAMIDQVIATGRWTIAAQTPPGGKRVLLSQFPAFPPENIVEWEQTDAGFTRSVTTSNLAATSYTNSRGTYGTRSVSNYYVQPNLSAVTQADLNKLTDLSHKFKVHTVTHEAEIQPFIEGKTGSYVFGSAYFQLTKKEKVGGDKEVLIRDKATKRIFGGDEARKLVGLPAAVLNQDSKIEPGNHANFDIFLESRSPNRKLVRGSLVLHDFTLTVAKNPTFDVSVLTQNQTQTP